MLVNEQAEGIEPLRERIRALEEALRPFVAAPLGYASGVDRGSRWCSPKVRHDDMTRAREALDSTITRTIAA
jgi:hypothetical protein